MQLTRSEASLRSNRIRIEAIEGPIGTDLLRHICDLYGRDGDTRYAGLEFAHRVFNSNPAGRSYHVFARHGEEVIGCYAVIPVKVMAPKGTLWAGKGEALYVRKGYRSTALFLIQRGVSFATERGLQLQFGITHNRLESMVQRLGFEALPSVLDHRFRLLRPGDVQHLLSRTHLVAAHALKAAQATVGTAAAGLLRGLRVSIQVNRAEQLDSVFTAMTCAAPPGERQWSVAADEDSLRWRNNVGSLDVLSVDGRANEFVAVTRGERGANAEIIRWNVHQGGLVRALNILQFVIDKANQEGAATISLGPHADMSGKRNLQTAASLLGFVRWRVQRTIYVKAADPFFLDPCNLHLNWCFSI
jgi:hypothetical protein